MWALVNSTPFEAHVSAFRDHHGASFWAVWIKASFALRDGRPALFLADQTAVFTDPQYLNGDPENVMLADSDLAQPKGLVDLVVSGNVMPNLDGTPCNISMVLGDWRKALVLHPPRRANWRGTLVVDPQADVINVPLDARSGFGGGDTIDNPLGQGAGDSDAPAPLIYPDDPKGRRPAYFGAVSPAWPARTAFAGTYDAAWQTSRAPLLPHDFDAEFWQSAPADQRLARNMPKDSVLEVRGVGDDTAHYALPFLDLLTSTKIAGHWHPKQPELQTIAVDLDLGTVSLTYLATWPISQAAKDVDIKATKVQLNTFDSFRVAAEHATLFGPQRAQDEVM